MLFIKALFGRIQIYLLCLCIVYSLSVTALYLHSQNTSIELLDRAEKAEEAFKEEALSRKREKQGYEQDIKLLSSVYYKIEGHNILERDFLLQLSDMEREEDCEEPTPVIVPLKVVTNEQKKRIAKLDDKLPPDLVRLLQSAYQSGKGSVGSNQ